MGNDKKRLVLFVRVDMKVTRQSSDRFLDIFHIPFHNLCLCALLFSRPFVYHVFFCCGRFFSLCCVSGWYIVASGHLVTGHPAAGLGFLRVLRLQLDMTHRTTRPLKNTSIERKSATSRWHNRVWARGYFLLWPLGAFSFLDIFRRHTCPGLDVCVCW